MLQRTFCRRLSGGALCSMMLFAACGDDRDVTPVEVPQFGTVAGSVRTSDAGVPGVLILLSRGGPARSARSDINGEYRFERVEVGTWDITYSIPVGYLPAGTPANPISISVTANAVTSVGPLLFDLAPAIRIISLGDLENLGEVNGTVTYTAQAQDALGRPVPGVPLEWSVSPAWGSLRATTANNGLFQVAVHTLGPAEGSYTVTASAPTIPGRPKLEFVTSAVSSRVWLIGGESWYYYYDDQPPGFQPADVTVAPGQTVGWQWSTTLPHQLVFEDDPQQLPGPLKDHGTYSRKFETAGSFRFRCTQHSTSFTKGMVGIVRVQ